MGYRALGSASVLPEPRWIPPLHRSRSHWHPFYNMMGSLAKTGESHLKTGKVTPFFEYSQLGQTRHIGIVHRLP